MKRILHCTTGLALLALAVSAFSGSIHAGGKGTVITFGKLSSKTPADWKSEKPDNKFRMAQFTVPKVKGDEADADLVIFYFGPGSGGSAKDNIERWKSMFRAPAGKTLDDVADVKEMEIPGAKLTYLDIHGTYVYKFPPFSPRAKEYRKPNYRMLNVFFACEDGPYFIRITGPEKTIAKHKEGFDNWLKSFK